ncbi:FecR family protein [Aquiflexum sp.]|uniref:FecR family protein n=1 Tax=Aquiflexum sp. TaxID=1872584 RepID=UPI0035948D1B
MEQYKDIDGKIVKFLNATATKEERAVVDQWVQASKNNEFQFQKLKLIWEEPAQDAKLIGHEEQKKKIWKAFASGNHKSKNIPVIPLYRRTWLRIAVVLAIILFPVYTLYFHNKDIIEDNIRETSLITKSNPTGQKSLIQLPDGSKVWLNSDSRISYHERFSDSLRSINLKGEAYFEVVSDSLRPFVVDFGSLSVIVLGTEFNISAFEAEKDFKVTLVEGSVKVSNSTVENNLILKPGTGLIYSREKNGYREFSKYGDPELFIKTTEWRNGNLVFDGRNFEDFVREIKRWYGVQVQVKGIPPSGWNIRASFENELLINVMDAVSFNKGFSYALKDKELIIMFN